MADTTPDGIAVIASCVGEGGEASTELLVALAEAVRDCRNHDHPHVAEDIYCANLMGWTGERMAPVLRRLIAAEADADRLRAELARRTRDYAGVTAVRVRPCADGRWRVRYKRDGKNCSRSFDSRTAADEHAHSLRVEAAAKRAEVHHA